MIKQFTDSLSVLLRGGQFKVPLNYSGFMEWNQKQEKYWNLLKKSAEEPIGNFKVENNTFDKKINEMDAFSKEVNESLVKNIESDIYIGEGFFILNDLINITK